MKFLNLALILVFSFILNSCGKAQSSSADDNDCGYRYISGHDCIVCSKGGVSCKWRGLCLLGCTQKNSNICKSNCKLKNIFAMVKDVVL